MNEKKKLSLKIKKQVERIKDRLPNLLERFLTSNVLWYDSECFSCNTAYPTVTVTGNCAKTLDELEANLRTYDTMPCKCRNEELPDPMFYIYRNDRHDRWETFISNSNK